MEVSRKNLFGVPLWTASLPDVVPHHSAMANEIDKHIEAGGASSTALAHQTAIDPMRLQDPGWKILEARMNEVLADVIRKHLRRWRYGQLHIRRWAVQLGRLSAEEKARLPGEFTHNHLPALLSAVYYLRVPADLPSGHGGTSFFNPLANLMDLFGPRDAYEEPTPGKLLVFPAYLDHVPVPGTWDASENTRITISADVFFVSGEPDVPNGRGVAVGPEG